jgi:hypothetical protein
VIGKARSHVTAVSQVTFAVAEQMSARLIQGGSGVETRQCVEQVSLFGSGCAHISSGDDLHTLGFGYRAGTPRRAFVVAIEVPGDIDPQPRSLALAPGPRPEQCMAAIEERRIEGCVTFGQGGQAFGVFFEFIKGEEGG